MLSRIQQYSPILIMQGMRIYQYCSFFLSLSAHCSSDISYPCAISDVEKIQGVSKKLEEFTFCRMGKASKKTLNPCPSAFLRTLQLFLCKIQNSLFYFYPQRSASRPLLQYQHLFRQCFLSFKPKVHSLRSLKKYVRVLMAQIKKQFNTVKGIRNTMGCTNP